MFYFAKCLTIFIYAKTNNVDIERISKEMSTYFEYDFIGRKEPLIIDFDNMDEASKGVTDLQEKLCLLREVMEISDEWKEEKNRVIQGLLEDINDYLENLEDETLSLILRYKGINNLTWEEIETELNIELTDDYKEQVLGFLMES